MSLTDGEWASQERFRRLQSSIPASYTVYKDGSAYRAECNVAGGDDYSGADPVTVIHDARDALASTGGLISLREAVYESNTYPITLDVDGVSLCGVSSARDQEYFTAPPDPLARITKGTVLKNTGTATDTIKVDGKLFGISIKHLAIDFTQSSTGNGINCVAGTNDQGLSEFHFENIFVNNHDADSYALRMENPCQGRIEGITSYGGGLFEGILTTTTPTQFNCGNFVATQLYGWVTKSMTVAPIYVHRTASSGVFNLCNWNRMQINENVGLGSVPVLRFWNTDWMTFINLNLECNAGTTYAVDFGTAYHTVVINPCCNAATNWNVANSCSDFKVYGGLIDMTVLDDGDDSEYYGVAVTTKGAGGSRLFHCTVGATRKLTYNEGTATVANGTASIAVTHGLRTTPTNIHLTGTHTEVHEAYATSVGAAQFTITVDGNTTDDRDVYWQASCDQ